MHAGESEKVMRESGSSKRLWGAGLEVGAGGGLKAELFPPVPSMAVQPVLTATSHAAPEGVKQAPFKPRCPYRQIPHDFRDSVWKKRDVKSLIIIFTMNCILK